jgi:hypothetical protein
MTLGEHVMLLIANERVAEARRQAEIGRLLGDHARATNRQRLGWASLFSVLRVWAARTAHAAR